MVKGIDIGSAFECVGIGSHPDTTFANDQSKMYRQDAERYHQYTRNFQDTKDKVKFIREERDFNKNSTMTMAADSILKENLLKRNSSVKAINTDEDDQLQHTEDPCGDVKYFKKHDGYIKKENSNGFGDISFLLLDNWETLKQEPKYMTNNDVESEIQIFGPKPPSEDCGEHVPRSYSDGAGQPIPISSMYTGLRVPMLPAYAAHRVLVSSKYPSLCVKKSSVGTSQCVPMLPANAAHCVPISSKYPGLHFQMSYMDGVQGVPMPTANAAHHIPVSSKYPGLGVEMPSVDAAQHEPFLPPSHAVLPEERPDFSKSEIILTKQLKTSHLSKNKTLGNMNHSAGEYDDVVKHDKDVDSTTGKTNNKDDKSDTLVSLCQKGSNCTDKIKNFDSHDERPAIEPTKHRSRNKEKHSTTPWTKDSNLGIRESYDDGNGDEARDPKSVKPVERTIKWDCVFQIQFKDIFRVGIFLCMLMIQCLSSNASAVSGLPPGVNMTQELLNQHRTLETIKATAIDDQCVLLEFTGQYEKGTQQWEGGNRKTQISQDGIVETILEDQYDVIKRNKFDSLIVFNFTKDLNYKFTFFIGVYKVGEMILSNILPGEKNIYGTEHMDGQKWNYTFTLLGFYPMPDPSGIHIKYLRIGGKEMTNVLNTTSIVKKGTFYQVVVEISLNINRPCRQLLELNLSVGNDSFPVNKTTSQCEAGLKPEEIVGIVAACLIVVIGLLIAFIYWKKIKNECSNRYRNSHDQGEAGIPLQGANQPTPNSLPGNPTANGALEQNGRMEHAL